MRILADENVPIGLVEALIEVSQDVQWVARVAPGLLDTEVLARAARDDRILLTFVGCTRP